MLRQAALAAAMGLLLAVPAHAQAARNDAQAARSDARLSNEVARQIVLYPRFTVFDYISGNVDHGVVTLTGQVTMGVKATDIARRVMRIPGVVAVKNEIQTLPVSFFDDELRYRIARAIYGNPEFWQYASMPNPPIHIIVDNGHVTLRGVVNNDVERVLARNIADSFNAFSVDNKLRTDAEMRAMRARMN